METKATLVRTRVKCVKVYSYLLEDRECKALLLRTQVANFIAKGTIFCSLCTCNSLVDYILPNRLVGLVVTASVPGAEDPGFESRLRRDFSWVESYQ